MCKAVEEQVCFVNKEGKAMLRSGDDYLSFDNLEKALESVEGRLTTFFEEAIDFFEVEISNPKPVINKVIFFLDRINKKFKEEEDFSYKLQSNKDNIFETLKKIESIKIYHNKDRGLEKRIIRIRSKLISLFVQAEKLIKVRKANEEALKNISDHLRFCQSYLTSFFPEEKTMDPYSVRQIQEKLVFCSLELESAYHIRPYTEKFNNIFEYLSLDEDIKEFIQREPSQKICNRVKKARECI